MISAAVALASRAKLTLESRAPVEPGAPRCHQQTDEDDLREPHLRHAVDDRAQPERADRDRGECRIERGSPAAPARRRTE